MICTVCRCEIQAGRPVCQHCVKATIRGMDDTIKLLRSENVRLKRALRPAAPPILLVREGDVSPHARQRPSVIPEGPRPAMLAEGQTVDGEPFWTSLRNAIWFWRN